MKIIILAENLKKYLGVISRGIGSRPQLPILSGIQFKATKEGLSLFSTDLEVGFWVRAGANIEEEGDMVVPAKLFSELIGSLPAGPVELYSEKEVLVVKSGNIRAEIVGQTSDDFPSLPKSSKVQVELDVNEYRNKIDKICVSSAKDDTRPVLTGVLWSLDEGKLTLAATDGYRLGVDTLDKIKTDEKTSWKLILPARSLTEVAKVAAEFGETKLGMEFDKENQQVIFVMKDVEVSSRLISGEFPPYQQIVPNTYLTRVVLGKNELLEAVKRANLFARENANIVKVEAGDRVVRITAESSQIGSNQTEVDAAIEGEKVTVAFNAKYLLDYLSVCTNDNVVWETEGELKPSVFRVENKKEGEDDNWIQVIMPVRVQD